MTIEKHFENVDVSIISHSPVAVQELKKCSLFVLTPDDGVDSHASHTSLAGKLNHLKMSIDSPDLQTQLEVVITSDCGASFPLDGTVVLPLGTAGENARTAIIRSATHSEATALQADFRRILSQLKNIFDAKTEVYSSHMYFHYYGMLQHQQNMLQDFTRTGTYYWAIMSNRSDFEGKVVMDVGAGTGILSLFAAQAGAKKVYAVEASNMVTFAQKLFDSNGDVGSRIEIVHGKVEALLHTLPEKVDILISEPMGTLLVNERMLETYILARKHFLKPEGRMFPSLGRIFVAAFSDAVLHSELQSMAGFWLNQSFYGVNLESLHEDALQGYCNKVVIDAFDPGLLVSAYTSMPIDFASTDEADLEDFSIPLSFSCKGPGLVHGVACWFDVMFPGSSQQMWLSTAPGMATTHWFQLRCVTQTPLQIYSSGQVVTGTMRLKAHAAQSYDVHVSLETDAFAPDGTEAACPQQVSGVFDLKDPYYRQFRTNAPA